MILPLLGAAIGYWLGGKAGRKLGAAAEDEIRRQVQRQVAEQYGRGGPPATRRGGTETTMTVDRTELAEKLRWVEDNIDTMDGNTPLEFNEALVRVSGGPGGRFDINKLSEADAEELNMLCDALARENGHEWGD